MEDGAGELQVDQALEITELAYHRRATVNIGNYESEQIELSVTVRVPEGDPDGTYERAKKWVDSRVSEQIKMLTLERHKKEGNLL